MQLILQSFDALRLWFQMKLMSKYTAIGSIIGNIACSATGAPRGAGGGISANQTDPLWLDRNTVIRNVASQSQWGYGGGLYLSMGTRFTMTNNIIAGNNATQQGGGLAFDTDVPLPVTGTLLHNTFASNDAGTGDGQDAIHANLPRVILTGANNLFHDHRYALYADSGAGITLTRSLFFGNSAGDIYGKGVSNISPLTGQDPRLDSTQRLNAGSAAIDAGVNAGVVVDIDGDPRPMGGGFDIGADEFYQYTEWHMLYLPLVVR